MRPTGTLQVLVVVQDVEQVPGVGLSVVVLSECLELASSSKFIPGRRDKLNMKREITQNIM